MRRTLLFFLWMCTFFVSTFAQMQAPWYAGVLDMSVSGDTIYTATSDGLGCYDLKTGSYTVTPLPANLHQERMWHVACQDGKLYAGMYYGEIGQVTENGFAQLYKVPGQDGYQLVARGDTGLYAVNHVVTRLSAQGAKGFTAKRAAISSNFSFEDALTDSTGRMWLCGASDFGGLYRFENDTIVCVLDNVGNVVAIDSDQKGQLWVMVQADNWKLCKVNGDTLAASYETKELGTENVPSRCIAVDEDGNVWCCCKELLKFDGRQFTSCALPETPYVHCMKWVKGKLYMGTQTGLYVYDDGQYALVKGSATGVKPVTAVAGSEDAPCYNLQGMKIARPRPGTVYIQRGVKRMVGAR